MSTSAQNLAKIMATQKVEMFDHDPGATTAIICSPDGGTTKRYADLTSILHFFCCAKPAVVGGTGLTLLEIVVSSDAAFTSPNVLKSTTIAADSLNDYAMLEASAEEVAGRAAVDGVEYRYIAARLTMGTATDEAVVTYITLPRFGYGGLSANNIT